MKNISLLLFLFSLLFISCRKNEQEVPIDYPSYLQCKNSESWNTGKIKYQLIGSWRLYGLSCVWSSSGVTDTTDIRANFDTAGNFTVFDHANIRSQGTWKVVSSRYDSTYFELKLSSYEQLIEGEIFLCPDQVLFYESGSDLCDKVYYRIK